MVDTQSATVCLSSFQKSTLKLRICFPSTSILSERSGAVKGSHCRAARRALDGSGSF
jgi:hypothetical protein